MKLKKLHGNVNLSSKIKKAFDKASNSLAPANYLQEKFTAPYFQNFIQFNNACKSQLALSNKS